MNETKILERVYNLMFAYKDGKLGGEKMLEDENPGLPIESKENYMYFTLPMALNYQRNSYTLWECANSMYQSTSGKIFDNFAACQMPYKELRDCLVKYKVALQHNKQPAIWLTLCETINRHFDSDIRNLFIQNDYSVCKIKN